MKYIRPDGEAVYYGHIGHTKYDIILELIEHLENGNDPYVRFDEDEENALYEFIDGRLTDEMIIAHLSDQATNEEMRLDGDCSEDAYLDSIAESLEVLSVKVGFRELVDHDDRPPTEGQP